MATELNTSIRLRPETRDQLKEKVRAKGYRSYDVYFQREVLDD